MKTRKMRKKEEKIALSAMKLAQKNYEASIKNCKSEGGRLEDISAYSDILLRLTEAIKNIQA